MGRLSCVSFSEARHEWSVLPGNKTHDFLLLCVCACVYACAEKWCHSTCSSRSPVQEPKLSDWTYRFIFFWIYMKNHQETSFVSVIILITMTCPALKCWIIRVGWSFSFLLLFLPLMGALPSPSWMTVEAYLFPRTQLVPACGSDAEQTTMILTLTLGNVREKTL